MVPPNGNDLSQILGFGGDQLVANIIKHLSAADDWLDYEQLKSLLSGGKELVKDGTLRAKMKAIREASNRAPQLNFEQRREGRRSFFRLKRSSTGANVLQLESPDEAPSLEFARSIARERRIPAKFLFTLPTAASEWMHYSHDQAKLKAGLEAEFVSSEIFRDRILEPAIEAGGLNVIGGGVGEGLGEIKLIQDILTRNPSLRINYVFIDRSDVMAYVHHVTLKEMLRPHIDAGMLSYAGVCDDFYMIGQSLRRAQGAFKKERHWNSFCPDSWPTMVTLLGNNLGNEINREGDFLSSCREALATPQRARPVWLRLGVSTDQLGIEQYKPIEFALLLENLVHLRDVQGVLRTTDPKEFSQDTAAEACSVDHYEYLSNIGISGIFYRFTYQLRADIELQTDESIWETLPKDTEITTCHIVKFNLSSLERALKNLGFNVESEEPIPIAPEGHEARSYAVISATTMC